MLQNFGHKTAFIGKVGKDSFEELLRDTIVQLGIDATGLLFDEEIPTTLAFVHTHENGLEDLNEAKLLEMLTVANAGASLITTKKGALKVMPTEEEIRALIGQGR